MVNGLSGIAAYTLQPKETVIEFKLKTVACFLNF
jgi:hypothetical protein